MPVRRSADEYDEAGVAFTDASGGARALLLLLMYADVVARVGCGAGARDAGDGVSHGAGAGVVVYMAAGAGRYTTAGVGAGVGTALYSVVGADGLAYSVAGVEYIVVERRVGEAYSEDAVVGGVYIVDDEAVPGTAVAGAAPIDDVVERATGGAAARMDDSTEAAASLGDVPAPVVGFELTLAELAAVVVVVLADALPADAERAAEPGAVGDVVEAFFVAAAAALWSGNGTMGCRLDVFVLGVVMFAAGVDPLDVIADTFLPFRVDDVCVGA